MTDDTESADPPFDPVTKALSLQIQVTALTSLIGGLLGVEAQKKTNPKAFVERMASGLSVSPEGHDGPHPSLELISNDMAELQRVLLKTAIPIANSPKPRRRK
jgi:hypothetical protein